MFGFKRKPKPLTEEEYQAEYRRLLRQLNSQFAVGDGPWDQLVNSMGIIDHEMNGNGGADLNPDTLNAQAKEGWEFVSATPKPDDPSNGAVVVFKRRAQ